MIIALNHLRTQIRIVAESWSGLSPPFMLQAYSLYRVIVYSMIGLSNVYLYRCLPSCDILLIFRFPAAAENKKGAHLLSGAPSLLTWVNISHPFYMHGRFRHFATTLPIHEGAPSSCKHHIPAARHDSLHVTTKRASSALLASHPVLAPPQ